MSIINGNGDYELIEKGNGFVEKIIPLAYKELNGPNANGFYVPNKLYMKMLDEVPGLVITDVGDASGGVPGMIKMEHIIGRIISIDKENLTAKVKLLKGKYIGSLDDAVLGFNMKAHHDVDTFNRDGYITIEKVTPQHGHLLYKKMTAYKRKMKEKGEK